MERRAENGRGKEEEGDGRGRREEREAEEPQWTYQVVNAISPAFHTAVRVGQLMQYTTGARYTN